MHFYDPAHYNLTVAANSLSLLRTFFLRR